MPDREYAEKLLKFIEQQAEQHERGATQALFSASNVQHPINPFYLAGMRQAELNIAGMLRGFLETPS